MIRGTCFLFGKMKPCCPTLIACRCLTNFASQPSICPQKLTGNLPSVCLNFNHTCKLHSYPFQLLGLRGAILHAQNKFCPSEPSCGQHWGCSRVALGENVCGMRCFPSDYRNYSSRIEAGGNDTNFEGIHAKEDANAKPLGVEKSDIKEEIRREIRDVAVKHNLGKEGERERVSNDDVVVAQKAEESEIEEEAWMLLRNAIVTYCSSPVGTLAANDPNDKMTLNYDQVFIRDFIPSALAFLMKGEGEIVKNFLLYTLQLQSWEKTVDCYSPGQGLMPASFKVRTVPLDANPGIFEEVLDPDFGESAIGRVAPVDSGLWWIILLRAYGKLTGDYALQQRVDVQTGIRLILNLCLTDGFDMFPTLLVTDGSCMIDRRMGIHGHPLEIQALFYSALRCSREMLIEDEGAKNLIRAINNRLSALSFHIREYFWVDMKKINEIYRYKTEEYSMDATNKFNIYPEQIPHWLMDWIPGEGGFMIGNLQPGHMDFRFFTLGNLWSVIASLGTPRQNEAILNLFEAKWDDLVGDMPLKICYPAMENEEWRIVTGSDPKNTPWSYHNGGSWPTLLWQFTLACLKMGRSDMAEKALKLAERELSKDRWPEYYDTRYGKFLGKQARLYQTWTIAGYLSSKMLLENPRVASLLYWDEDYDLLEMCVCALNKSGRKICSRGAARSQILV